ncbi:hypothetical protein GOBAR_DD14919 [Gossypium barbadense]|nr:hypothetical protein GOBAR_DD14919 [Gossypium barbadense]
MSSSAELDAGLIGLWLQAVHRCSIGAGAGLERVPAGKQVSDTHYCPPQSKHKISSLHPTRYPSDFLQNSASA